VSPDELPAKIISPLPPRAMILIYPSDIEHMTTFILKPANKNRLGVVEGAQTISMYSKTHLARH